MDRPFSGMLRLVAQDEEEVADDDAPLEDLGDPKLEDDGTLPVLCARCFSLKNYGCAANVGCSWHGIKVEGSWGLAFSGFRV
jgi:hypothetical protein